MCLVAKDEVELRLWVYFVVETVDAAVVAAAVVKRMFVAGAGVVE